MPNDKIVRLVRYFHLSLGIFLLISVLLLNGCSSRADGVKISWNDASKVPASLMQLVQEGRSTRAVGRRKES